MAENQLVEPALGSSSIDSGVSARRIPMGGLKPSSGSAWFSDPLTRLRWPRAIALTRAPSNTGLVVKVVADLAVDLPWVIVMKASKGEAVIEQ